MKYLNDKRSLSSGGDSWRVQFSGPAILSGTVYDYNNGTYEVVALFMDPGLYFVTATLDYSMCDGYKNPPIDWFQKGKPTTIFTLNFYSHRLPVDLSCL